MTSRDNFSSRDKHVLAARVNYRCSSPNCRKPTSGPRNTFDGVTNIGVAAHITAAAPRGPRYDSKLSSKERKSVTNGIWLCQSCAKLIDDDPTRFTVKVLIRWKTVAEETARFRMERSHHEPWARRTKESTHRHSRVLLPELDARRSFKGKNDKGEPYFGTSIDYSIYPFLIEELVALGTSRIAVVRGTGQENAIPAVSNLLSDRFLLIETSDLAHQIRALLSPIGDEFCLGLEFSDMPIYGGKCRRTTKIKGVITETESDIFHVCCQLYPILFKFAIGIKYELEIDVDLDLAARCVSTLRDTLKSREARDVTALISGLIASYDVVELTTFGVSKSITQSGDSAFLELIQSDQFERMTFAAYQFGLQGKSGSAVAAFENAAKILLTSPSLGKFLLPAKRLTQLFTSNGSREFIDEVAKRGNAFLPPVLPFGDSKRLAGETWQKLQPDPITGQHDSFINNDTQWDDASFSFQEE